MNKVKNKINHRSIMLIGLVVCLLVVVFWGMGVSISNSYATPTVARGTSGTCNWVIDANGVLTISPTNGVSGQLASLSGGPSGAPWYNYRTQIKSVASTGNIKLGANCSYMFGGCSSLTDLSLLSGWDTSSVTDMSWMFSGCSSLADLSPLSGWDTGSAMDMSHMFQSCSSLTDLDLSGLDTSSVTDMSGMFFWCSSLSKIGIGENFSFKGNNITDTSKMALLPTPPSATATGKWVMLNSDGNPIANSALTAEQMRDAGNPGVGTWVWQLKNASAIIDLDTNGGVLPSGMASRISQSAATAITLPTPTRNGFTFIGWNASKNGGGTNYAPNATYTPAPATMVTLYAQWLDPTAPQPITVKHYVQNSELTGYDLVATENVTVEPENMNDYVPTPNGYDGAIFASWKVNNGAEHFTGDGATENLATNDVVSLYYDRATTEIEYDGNGADHGQMANQSLISRIGGWLQKNVFSRIGYIFDGWSTTAAPEESSVNYADEQPLQNLSQRVLKLFAKWREAPTAQVGEDGTYTVTVKGGESKTFANLPAGTQYEIVETDIPAGWTQTSAEGMTGTIQSNITSEAQIHNTYNADGEISIQIHKILNGGNIQEGMFQFRLKDSTGNILQTVSNEDMDMIETLLDQETGESYQNPNYGKASVTFEPIEYTAEGTYVYTIEEVVGNSQSITYDSEPITATVTVVDAGHGNLSTSVVYSRDSFVNRMMTGDVSIQIHVVDSFDNNTPGNPVTTDDEFDVTVQLTDPEGNPLPDEYTYTKPDGTESKIKNGDTIKISPDQPITIKDIPTGSHYNLIQDPKDGYEKHDVQTNGTVGDGGISEVKIYDVPNITTLQVSKTVTGNLANKHKSFNFTLTLKDEDDNPVQGTFMYDGDELGSLSIDVYGQATFALKHGETITIRDLPIGASYVITEDDYSDKGYIVSESENIEGVLSFENNPVTFTNMYNAVVPNGLVMSIGGPIVGTLLVAGIVIGIVVVKKKHKTDDENEDNTDSEDNEGE